MSRHKDQEDRRNAVRVADARGHNAVGVVAEAHPDRNYHRRGVCETTAASVRSGGESVRGRRRGIGRQGVSSAGTGESRVVISNPGLKNDRDGDRDDKGSPGCFLDRAANAGLAFSSRRLSHLHDFFFFKKEMTEMGLEPTISSLGVKCVIHYATRPRKTVTKCRYLISNQYAKKDDSSMCFLIVWCQTRLPFHGLSASSRGSVLSHTSFLTSSTVAIISDHRISWLLISILADRHQFCPRDDHGDEYPVRLPIQSGVLERERDRKRVDVYIR